MQRHAKRHFKTFNNSYFPKLAFITQFNALKSAYEILHLNYFQLCCHLSSKHSRFCKSLNCYNKSERKGNKNI